MEANRDYAPGDYGDDVANAYDDLHADQDPTQAVDALAALARSGRALELGIGTGRVALPLAEHGIDVHGIDASRPMVARLRAKPGGDAIPITMGNFADVGVDGDFALIFVVFNTFFSLITQDEQLRCLRNVAAHLGPGGAFVIECFVPDLSRYNEKGQSLRANEAGADVLFHVSQLDRAQQRISTRFVSVGRGTVAQYGLEIRYAWPSELDLMARAAGLRLRERWGDWQGNPFTSTSQSHVSVYERASG